MPGHRTICDCIFIVLLHIALCMCVALFVCLPRGAFCFASHPTPAQSFHPTQMQDILPDTICRYSGRLLVVGIKPPPNGGYNHPQPPFWPFLTPKSHFGVVLSPQRGGFISA